MRKKLIIVTKILIFTKVSIFSTTKRYWQIYQLLSKYKSLSKYQFFKFNKFGFKYYLFNPNNKVNWNINFEEKKKILTKILMLTKMSKPENKFVHMARESPQCCAYKKEEMEKKTLKTGFQMPKNR